MANGKQGRDSASYRAVKRPKDGFFAGNPIAGRGFGKFPTTGKHKQQADIDNRETAQRRNKAGKGTATRRGDRFLNQTGFSFGNIRS